MWSSILEMYPVHVSPTTAVQGTALVQEPKTEIKPVGKAAAVEYLVQQRTSGPYGMRTQYSQRLWVC
jgi:hypothetical protein